MTGPRGPVVVLLVALAALTGCGGHPSSAAQPPTTQSRPAAPQSSASTPPSTRASNGRLPVIAAARLRCEGPIGGFRRPLAGWRAAGGTVALVVRNPQSFAVTPDEAPHRRWEKSPLAVRLGRTATVGVPAAWARRVAFTWGTEAQLAAWTTRLVIRPCHQRYAGNLRWVVFPGGYSFDHPACVPIRVTVAGRSKVLHVALGHGITCSTRG